MNEFFVSQRLTKLSNGLRCLPGFLPAVIIFLSLQFGAASSPRAWAMPLDLAKDLPSGLDISLFDASSEKKLKSLSSLAQLKYHEIRLNAVDCDRLAPAVFAKHKELKGWIGLSWLRCTRKKVSEQALSKISAIPGIFERGPWADSLWASWSDQSLAVIETFMKKKTPASNIIAQKKIENLLDFADKLQKDDRATLFRALGDINQQKKEYARALFYFEESAGLKESTFARDHIRFLRKALDIPSDDKKSANNSVDDEEAEIVAIVPGDQQIEDRMQATLKAGETIAAIKDAVEILNNFPGSRVARRLKDKPIEIYNTLFDRGSQIEDGILNKAIDIVSDADPSRLTDWAQSLHRRADYQGALFLAEKALLRLRNSTSATSLLWIAGRSAQFTGQYDKAIKHFDELALKHRSTEEASEAIFRTGLIQYRLRNDSTAVVLFDKVLAEKRDRYDLSSRYWLYRSLQRSKSLRAAAALQEIVTLYPFSYYGIRLRAEMNNNKVTWPAVLEKIESKQGTVIWLEANQVESWKRFAELTKSGWITEAQSELQGFPALANPQAQILLGKKLSQIGISSLAIRWLNDAMEQDPHLRNKEVMTATFPQNFKESFDKEAARNEVSPRLLMSLTRQESAFNTRATSSSNALGLMQLIPPTAREVAQKLGYKKLEIPDDLFRPEVNVAMGTFYIADMLKQFKYSVPFALASYNAGPSRMQIWVHSRSEVEKQLENFSSAPEDEIWFDELPWNETSFYVKAILRNTLLYKLMIEGEFDLGPVVWSDLVSKKPASL